MGKVGRFFKTQFQLEKFTLAHDDASDFYISCWQANRAALPYLLIKILLFIGCLGTLISSIVLTGTVISLSYWPIYMTHWGIILITVTSGFAVIVSLRAYVKGPIDGTFGLPWYVKVYWVLFNVTISLAIYITAFYYLLLTSADEEYAFNKVLDVFAHAMNTVFMVLLLFTSRHPAYVLHFYMPVLGALVYLVFSLIYYYAGGTDPRGYHTIYPMLDWESPVATVILVVISAVLIMIIHIIVVFVTIFRDYLTKKLRSNSDSLSIS